MPIILAPLPYVAVHVIQPKVIRNQLSYRLRALRAIVPTVPHVVRAVAGQNSRCAVITLGPTAI